MVAAPNAPHRATLADLDQTPDDGRRYELIDGEMIVSAAPTRTHQRVVARLVVLLETWVQPRGLGEVFPSPVDIVLEDRDARVTSVQPDVVFISAPKLAGQTDDRRFHGIPDLVVEVLSPTSQGYDAVTKLLRYLRAAVPEYWLVDPKARTFLVLRLEGDAYVPVEPDGDGCLASAVLPGLIVDPAAVFAAAGLPPVE